MSVTVVFCGLPYAGKTTLARGVQAALRTHGIRCEVLDVDDFRDALPGVPMGCRDRAVLSRMVIQFAEVLNRNGLFALVPMTMASSVERGWARGFLTRSVFVLCDCPLQELRRRDTLDLYAMAESGILPDFPGIGQPFESCTDCDVVVDTGRSSVRAGVAVVLPLLELEENWPSGRVS